MEENSSTENQTPITESTSKRNDWKILSGILAIVVIALLVYMFLGKGITGNVISEKDANTKVLEYLNSRTGGGVESVSTKDLGNLYEVTVSYQGNNIPVYITKDGGYFVQGAIPITGNAIGSTNTTDQTPQEVTKSDKPMVELFVMSHCPYGVKAQEVLVPVMKLLGNKANIKTRFVDYAMHGKQEIDDNNIEYCIQKEQESKYISYLTCFVGSENSKECIKSVKVDETKLNSCINVLDKQFKITELYNNQSTWLSGRYPLYPVNKELTTKYGVQGSESLIINGVKISPVQYRWDSEKLKQLICSAFNAAPSECSKKLEASNSSSALSAGSCG